MPPIATDSPADLDYGLRGRIFDVAERIIVLALLGFFLARFAAAPGYQIHDLLIVAAELLVGVFILARRRGPPVNDGIAWTAALIGAGAPLLVVPGGAPLGNPLVFEVVGSLIMTVGCFLNLGAKLFLRRSFGLVAANRGVKVDGPYRLVRHPMYAGYLLTHVGFLLAGFVPWNLWVYAVCWAAMIVRIRAEERVLSEDPDYIAYARSVRFRLIPGIW